MTRVISRFARVLFTRLLTPTARALLRLGVSPDVVTVLGTVGVCVGGLVLYPRGELFWGTMVIVVFAFSDTLDGTMARLSGRPSRWGAFLDSTLDRIGDAALFVGVALWFAGRGDNLLLAALSLWCLVAGSLVSYAKARAEGLGMTADVGIAERADRLVLALLVIGFHGIGTPYVLAIGLWGLGLASTVTFGQRVWAVRRQVLAAPPVPPTPPAAR